MADNGLSGPLRLDRAIKAAKLSGVDKGVLHVLRSYLEYTRWSAFPSVETIALESGWSKNTTLASIARLERMGVLVCNRKHRTSTVYFIKIVVLESLSLGAADGPKLGAADGPKNQPGSICRTSRVHLPDVLGAAGGPQQTIEQTNEQTTTTTGDRGGGGDSLSEAQERIKARLISAGVSESEALRHAAADPCRVAFALDCAKKSKAVRPGLYIVSLIEKPERYLDGYAEFAAKFNRRRDQLADGAAAKAPAAPDPYVLPRGESLKAPVPLGALVAAGRAKKPPSAPLAPSAFPGGA